MTNELFSSIDDAFRDRRRFFPIEFSNMVDVVEQSTLSGRLPVVKHVCVVSAGRVTLRVYSSSISRS